MKQKKTRFTKTYYKSKINYQCKEDNANALRVAFTIITWDEKNAWTIQDNHEEDPARQETFLCTNLPLL